MTWDEIFFCSCYPAIHGLYVKPTGKSCLFQLYFSWTSVMAWVNPQSLSYTSAVISVSFPRFLLIPSKISHFSYVIIDLTKISFFFSWQSTLILDHEFLYFHRCFFLGQHFPDQRTICQFYECLWWLGSSNWVGVSNPERVHGGEQALRSWWPTRWGFCWRIFGFFSYLDSSGIVGVLSVSKIFPLLDHVLCIIFKALACFYDFQLEMFVIFCVWGTLDLVFILMN